MKPKPTLLAGFAAIAAAHLVFTSCEKTEAPKALPPPEVLVAPAATRDVPVYREWVGTVDGSENAQIRAKVTGYLLKRDYPEGSLVKKGDMLFEIDSRPFEAALAEAKSQLAQGKATQLASQSSYERNKQLWDKKVISEQEYINSTQLNDANIAKVGALQAGVEEATLNLGYCKIASPVDGIAGNAQAQVGDLVGTASGTVLTTVSTLDPVKLIFPVSEGDYLEASKRIEDIRKLPFDQRPESIELILADGSVFPQKGRLFSVNRQVNESTGTILVTALLANPGSLLRPGFFARARILTDNLKDAVVVPQRAVAEVQGSFQLGVVGADGKAEIRPVKVGPQIGSDWVIASGLTAGEKVIVEGLQKVRTGAPVSAKPWTPPAETAPAPATAEAKPAAQAETK
ncbi:MAG TPA: efflux RND transporter periplasmic adaptor subunit [Chthoniobacter sp.]|jgi:membrane fusion protein (multidrug efflux system)